jgi:hypothetical protein
MVSHFAATAPRTAIQPGKPATTTGKAIFRHTSPVATVPP